jgi:predicted small metal-binding protein
MKTMNCRQLGGACEKEFRASSFAEIAEMSKQHGMEMFQAKDAAHIEAMNEMRQLMQKPDAMAALTRATSGL